MCNAWNHPDDCTCGFGPPYPDLKITVRRWADRRNPNPRTLAEVSLLFPIPRANFLADLDSAGMTRVKAAAREVLQDLANKRFGLNRLRITTTHLAKGSLELGILVLMVGLAYAFFKDYEDLRKGVQLFLGDVRAVSRYLRQRVQRAYSREEKRVQKAKGGKRTRGANAGSPLPPSNHRLHRPRSARR